MIVNQLPQIRTVDRNHLCCGHALNLSNHSSMYVWSHFQIAGATIQKFFSLGFGMVTLAICLAY